MLAAGGDDEAHGEQAFNEETAEVGAALAKSFGFVGEAALVVAQSDDTDGEKRDAGEEEAPIEQGHEDETADEEEHVGEYGEQRVGADALDFADVIVDARDDVAEFGLGEEARRELLKVAEDREAHVEKDLGGEADVAIAGSDVHGETDDGDDDHQRSNLAEGAHVVAEQSVVDEEPRNVGLRESDGGGEQAQERDEREAAPVGRD